MKTKICVNCKEEKKLELFNKRANAKDGYQHRCKSCHAEYNKRHYQKNKELYCERAKQNKKRVREWFYDMKSKLSCEKCGEKKHWRLAFHHIDPSEKDMTISELLSNDSKKKIKDEMKKCMVLCHNCHTDVHYEERINGSWSG